MAREFDNSAVTSQHALIYERISKDLKKVKDLAELEVLHNYADIGKKLAGFLTGKT